MKQKADQGRREMVELSAEELGTAAGGHSFWHSVGRDLSIGANVMITGGVAATLYAGNAISKAITGKSILGDGKTPGSRIVVDHNHGEVLRGRK